MIYEKDSPTKSCDEESATVTPDTQLQRMKPKFIEWRAIEIRKFQGVRSNQSVEASLDEAELTLLGLYRLRPRMSLSLTRKRNRIRRIELLNPKTKHLSLPFHIKN
jgi:hypothetical protein